MKKVFAFVAAALACASVNADGYKLANPVGEDGRYIVKWDCAKGEFAASNDFEPGETFVIAIDVTGTTWEEELKNPANPGTTRCMAANIWCNYGPKKDATNRFKQIEGNVYGATFNMQQMWEDADPSLKGKLTAKDTIMYANGQLFMYAYDAQGNDGVEWYVDAQEVKAEGSDCFFATLPSTGKSDPVFYTDDFEEKIFSYSLAGYAAPCVMEEPSALEHVKAVKGLNKFIEGGHLYFKAANGQIVNALGATVLR